MSTPNPLARAATRWAVVSATAFYRFERAGGSVPPGPTVVVANHPNMLMDPLLALAVTERPIRVLAKAPHFRTPIFGSVLRGMRAIAVYRRRDDPAVLSRNRAALRAAARTLVDGGSLLLFPEGGSGSRAELAPMKPGTARIALMAEEATAWTLGLRVVPVGLTYERKGAFRSRALAMVGPPLRVADWRDRHAADPSAAVRSLTDAIGAALARSALHLSDDPDADVVETAERVAAIAGGATEAGSRAGLARRFAGLRRWWRRLRDLRERDPATFAGLAHALRALGARLGRIGVTGLPASSAVERRSVLGRLAVTLVGFPFAAVGILAWYLPARAAGWAGRLSPDRETVATIKLLAGMVLLPLAWIAWTAMTWRVLGPVPGLVALIGLPPLGLAAVQWRRLAGDLVADVRRLLRARLRPRERREVMAEIEKLAGRLEDETVARGPVREAAGPTGRNSAPP